jgi:predicted aconitase
MSGYRDTQVEGSRDPREGLEAVVALRRMLEALEVAQVDSAYLAGWSWARIAEAEVLWVSNQAVHEKRAKRIRAKYAEAQPRRKGKGA